MLIVTHSIEEIVRPQSYELLHRQPWDPSPARISKMCPRIAFVYFKDLMYSPSLSQLPLERLPSGRPTWTCWKAGVTRCFHIKLRSRVKCRAGHGLTRCLWTKGTHKSNDILLSICHKGHLFDPTQLKLYVPFKVARAATRQTS